MRSIERLIKSSDRVKQHGEVFTPSWMVKKMLDTPGVKEASESITETFLEPAAGDGNFLVAILNRKLETVKEKYLDKSLLAYENYALLSLTSLYGIELLEDNAQMCAMNLATTFQKAYMKVAETYDEDIKEEVIKSANYIISKNIVNGNFLTRKNHAGEPITFTEWDIAKTTKEDEIIISQTDYTLDDIYEDAERDKGSINDFPKFNDQYDLFADFDFGNEEKEPPAQYGYADIVITQVYKEVLEYYDE